MKNIDNLFRTNAELYRNQQAIHQRIQAELMKKQSERFAQIVLDRQAKLSRLIGQAQKNLTRMLGAQSKELESYMQLIFMKARIFQDGCGIFGFKIPELKWRRATGDTLRQLHGLGGPKPKILEGTLDDHKITVRVLELYTEKVADTSVQNGTIDSKELVDGSRKPHRSQIIALACQAPNGFTSSTIEQMRKMRVVHLTRTITSSPLEVDYSRAEPVSMDNGFMDTLLDLVDPSSTLKFLFSRFDLSEDK